MNADSKRMEDHYFFEDKFGRRVYFARELRRLLHISDDKRHIPQGDYEVRAWAEDGRKWQAEDGQWRTKPSYFKIRIKLIAIEDARFADRIGTVWNFRLNYEQTTASFREIDDFFAEWVKRTFHETQIREFFFVEVFNTASYACNRLRVTEKEFDIPDGAFPNFRGGQSVYQEFLDCKERVRTEIRQLAEKYPNHRIELEQEYALAKYTLSIHLNEPGSEEMIVVIKSLDYRYSDQVTRQLSKLLEAWDDRRVIGSGSFSGLGMEKEYSVLRDISVSIPEGITIIEDEAFKPVEIQSVELPGSLEAIGARAFADSIIDQIRIPEKVTYIGQDAFDDRVQVAVDSKNKNFVIIDRKLYERRKADAAQKAAQEKEAQMKAQKAADAIQAQKYYAWGCKCAANDDPANAMKYLTEAVRLGHEAATSVLRAAEGDPHWWRHM